MTMGAQKTPLSRSINLLAQRKVLEEINKRGKTLPGHVISVQGALVTVNFDVEGALLPSVQMAVAQSQYIVIPIQPGDKGVAIPADVYIGSSTGLGSSTAGMTLPANLTSLIWVPVSNSAWAGAGGAIQLNADVETSDNVAVGNGASGTFTTGTGQTVDVLDGIVVNIY